MNPTRTVFLLPLLVACGTQYVQPDVVEADMEREEVLSDLEQKLALAEDAGIEVAEMSAYRSTCGAERCAADLAFLDVYVSEVMADPTTCTDSTGEWVEVYNDTDFTVDLNGAILEDRSSGARSTLSNVAILAPHSYAVLGKGSNPCGVAVDGTFSSGIALNNGGDGLYLRRPDEALIDYVITWPAAAPGVSFETSSGDWWRWLSAVDAHGDELATPGWGPEDEGYVRPLAQAQEGRLDISEIMADPSCAYDSCEWIELHNTSWVAQSIDGLSLVDAGGNEDLFDGVVLEAGERAVFGRYRADSWDEPSVSPVGFYGNVGLNNGGESLMLVDGERVLFATPFFDGFEAGVSYELTGWDSESLDSWELAVDAIAGSSDLGTPGY